MKKNIERILIVSIFIFALIASIGMPDKGFINEQVSSSIRGARTAQADRKIRNIRRYQRSTAKSRIYPMGSGISVTDSGTEYVIYLNGKRDLSIRRFNVNTMLQFNTTQILQRFCMDKLATAIGTKRIALTYNNSGAINFGPISCRIGNTTVTSATINNWLKSQKIKTNRSVIWSAVGYGCVNTPLDLNNPKREHARFSCSVGTRTIFEDWYAAKDPSGKTISSSCIENSRIQNESNSYCDNISKVIGILPN